jgi:hypothetical protein
MESQSHEHFMPCGIANPNHIASVTRQDPLSSWMKEVNSNFLMKRELFLHSKRNRRNWHKMKPDIEGRNGLLAFAKPNILSFFWLFGRAIYSSSYLIWLFTVLANILPGWTRSDIPRGVPASSKVFKRFTKPFFKIWVEVWISLFRVLQRVS